jgi:hypothetical protein
VYTAALVVMLLDAALGPDVPTALDAVTVNV